MSKKDCGCRFRGPVQILTCGEHNVAAKNLNRAQALLTKAEIRIQQLEVGLTKRLDQMDMNEKMTWGAGIVLNGLAEGNLRSSVATIILSVNHEAYDRGVKAGIADEQRRQKERRGRKRK